MPKRSAEQQQQPEARREAGEQVADREPGDRDHQRLLAADPVGEPAGGGGADQPHPQGQGEDDGDLGQRHAEVLGNRHHQQQENGEVESIEGPPEPGGDPGEPLILGWFLPPWNRNCVRGCG